MALTELQKGVVRCLAFNRSETSYMAGGLVLNHEWPRVSDDVDIFHDTDEEIGAAADKDIDTLRDAGYRVAVDVEIYGCVEATVSKDGQSTLIQWMSETKRRFFPLIRDDEWGSRLHQADLAVNKVIAASSRTKPRDFVDLATIQTRWSSLGPLVLAAAGKPPHFSPQKIIDEIRRRGMSVSNEGYDSVKGLPAEWNAAFVRETLAAAIEAAEDYILKVPIEAVGLLSVDENGAPVEVSSMDDAGVVFRKATEEPEVMPTLADAPQEWKPGW